MVRTATLWLALMPLAVASEPTEVSLDDLAEDADAFRGERVSLDAAFVGVVDGWNDRCRRRLGSAAVLVGPVDGSRLSVSVRACVRRRDAQDIEPGATLEVTGRVRRPKDVDGLSFVVLDRATVR